MKVRVLLLGLAVLLGLGTLKAQNTTKNVVYLKNGSIIKCDIVEWQKDTIKFQTSDGSLFVYSMDEVEKISNTVVTNSQVSENKKQIPVGVKMKRVGTKLYLGDSAINDNELKQLLNQDCYETYISANRQSGVSFIFLGPGFISAFAGLCLILDGVKKQKNAEINSGYVLCGVADVFIPIGFIINGCAKGRIGWVAEQYNNGIRAENSISVSPSILQFNDIAKGQNSYALGATLSIKF